jgi:hypothetical protein
MGASASIQTQTNIYVSYDERDIQGSRRIQQVCDILKKQEIFKNNKYHFISHSSTTTNLEMDMEKAACIIFCISAYTHCSYKQNLELKTAIQNDTCNKKILYIITTEKFNPKENPETKAIIGNNKWKPLYDEKYATELITDVLLQYG